MSTTRTQRGGAFTLVELLVVISIFVLLLAIGVPAFSSLLYSNDQSLAENALRQGLNAARDAAIRSGSGEDAAAVFFYDQRRLSIVVARKVGVYSRPAGDLEVFAPIPGFAPAQMPQGWVVRAFAPPGRLYESQDGTGGQPDWYEDTNGGANSRTSHWLFPETSFFDTDQGDDGERRQTFMVRFEGGTGRLRKGIEGPVLVFSPSPGSSFRTSAPWVTFRADREADFGRFIRRVNVAPLTQAQKDDLIGPDASDMVLAKPLSQIAMHNEDRLAASLGGQTDGTTGCLYAPGLIPAFVTIPGLSAAQVPTEIDRWIEDRASNGSDSDARIFVVHPLGLIQELTGSRTN